MAKTPLELVLTSEADLERAEALARSLYHWPGRIENGSEVLVLLKTHGERLAELRETIGQLHSYETPMWIHWTAATEGDYAHWLAAELALA